MKTKHTLTGHATAFIAYAIFGFNIIVCKDLPPHLYDVCSRLGVERAPHLAEGPGYGSRFLWCDSCKQEPVR